MKRFNSRHLVIVGGAVLLMALVLALAVPGMAAARKMRPPDTTAPITTDNAAVAPVDGVFTLVLAPVDRTGVEATWYRIDGGAWILGDSVLIREAIAHKGAGLAVGTHTIEYYSVDVLGNVEAIQSCTITI